MFLENKREGDGMDDGFGVEEMFDRLIDRVLEDESIEYKVKLKTLMKAGDYAYYLSNGYSPKLQLKSVIALLMSVLNKESGNNE